MASLGGRECEGRMDAKREARPRSGRERKEGGEEELTDGVWAGRFRHPQTERNRRYRESFEDGNASIAGREGEESGEGGRKGEGRLDARQKGGSTLRST